MSEIRFAEDAWNEYLWWQTQDRKTLKRINALLKEIQRTPFEGTGKPEALKGSANWSRRIDDKNRLVYEVQDGAIRQNQTVGFAPAIRKVERGDKKQFSVMKPHPRNWTIANERGAVFYIIPF